MNIYAYDTEKARKETIAIFEKTKNIKKELIVQILARLKK